MRGRNVTIRHWRGGVGLIDPSFLSLSPECRSKMRTLFAIERTLYMDIRQDKKGNARVKVR